MTACACRVDHVPANVRTTRWFRPRVAPCFHPDDPTSCWNNNIGGYIRTTDIVAKRCCCSCSSCVWITIRSEALVGWRRRRRHPQHPATTHEFGRIHRNHHHHNTIVPQRVLSAPTVIINDDFDDHDRNHSCWMRQCLHPHGVLLRIIIIRSSSIVRMIVSSIPMNRPTRRRTRCFVPSYHNRRHHPRYHHLHQYHYQ